MPKATIDKDRYASIGETKIRTSGDIRSVASPTADASPNKMCRNTHFS
jgi:hypothetical protein